MTIGDRSFDQVAFGRAIEAGDVGYQVSRYANHAQVQVRKVDWNNTSPAPMLQLLGAPAIQAWIHATAIEHTKPPIVTLHVIDDHLAFIERWRHRNGLSHVVEQHRRAMRWTHHLSTHQCELGPPSTRTPRLPAAPTRHGHDVAICAGTGSIGPVDVLRTETLATSSGALGVDNSSRF